MKRKLTFLPLILVVPLLVGCGELKEPKFADFGNEVDCATFNEHFQTALSEFDYYKDDKVGSTHIEVNQQIFGYAKQTVGKEVLMEEKEEVNSATKMQSDVDHLIGHSDEVTKVKVTVKAPGTKLTSNSKKKESYHVQEGTHEDKKYCIMVDQKMNRHTGLIELSDSISMADALDMAVKSNFLEYYYIIQARITAYSSASEEEQAKYHFYESGKIFSIKYEDKVENKESKNAEDQVYAVENSSSMRKWQIDLTPGGNFEYKFYEEGKETVEYKLNYGSSHAQGEVIEELFKESEVVSAKQKKANLKATDKLGQPYGF